jgi:hypothetical protein
MKVERVRLRRHAPLFLHVQVQAPVSNETTSVDFIFDFRNRCRPAWVFTGCSGYITAFRDLGGDGNMEAITWNGFLDYDGMSHMGSPIIRGVLGWRRGKLVARSRAFPFVALKLAGHYRCEIIRLLTHPKRHESGRLSDSLRGAIAGYYGNMVVAGCRRLAMTWIAGHVPGSDRKAWIARQRPYWDDHLDSESLQVRYLNRRVFRIWDVVEIGAGGRRRRASRLATATQAWPHSTRCSVRLLVTPFRDVRGLMPCVRP